MPEPLGKATVIGLGLIGGSLARALREADFVETLVGCDPSDDVLQRGLDLGVVDRAETELERAVEQADLVVIASPTQVAARLLEQVLDLVPDSEIIPIERCSGHDGTYGVRKGTYAKSKKIARPVVNRVQKAEADYLVSDCPMAATQIGDELDLKNSETNPLSLLRHAYGI